jgi:hypothetical protein
MAEDGQLEEHSADALKHVNFAQSVLYRPKMYTLYGSFGEVIAFLNGFYSGALRYSRMPAENRAAKCAEWFGFRDWLKHRTEGEEGRFWERFREPFNSDAEAFEDMLRLYDEYIDEAGITSV